ncbi:MAG: DEAD/DEAH box helicase [Thermoguttaceae bacterium]
MKSLKVFSRQRSSAPAAHTPRAGCYELRRSQVPAFEALKDKQFAILDAPTGWGKTITLIALIAWKLLRNPQLRCIVTLPQTIIGYNFAEFLKFIVPGIGGIWEWAVPNNLCDPTAKDTIKNTIRFLSHKPGASDTLGDRVLICTHATMAHVYKRFKADDKLGLLNNCVLWIDEAHHVRNAQVEDSDKIVSNRLGHLVLHCVEHANRGLHVGLTTATYERGDKHHILPDKVLEGFAHHEIPFDQYLAEEEPVEHFEFNVICGEIFSVLEQLLKIHAPTIIFLAKRKTSAATACKYDEVRRIINIIGKDARQDGPVVVAGGRRILDLVDEIGRKDRQAYLAEKDAKVDVIIALETCKEGFNWRKAEQVIVNGERHSKPEMRQIMGRLFRSHPGKKSAKVFQILPVAVPDTKSFRDDRNAIFSAILLAMLLESKLVPLTVTGEDGKKVLVDKLPPRLSDKVGVTLMKDFLAAVQGFSYERSRKLAGSVLSKYGINEPEQQQKTWKTLWTRFAYKTRQIDGVTPDVPFEILRAADISGGFLTLASGLCGVVTCQEMRKAMRRENRSPEGWALVAEDLAKENGGLLPSYVVLAEKGLHGLIRAMHEHPKLFGHLKQDRERTRAKEWLDVANELMEKYGEIPSCAWLDKNGHRGLYHAMRNHPELFPHVTQNNRKTRTTEDWVLFAADLAEKNGGRLPCMATIRREHGGLYQAMRKYPELFKHITQEKKGGRTAEEWVPILEDLVEKHGRQVLRKVWLEKNGFSGLWAAMRKRPELFAHLTNAA